MQPERWPLRPDVRFSECLFYCQQMFRSVWPNTVNFYVYLLSLFIFGLLSFLWFNIYNQSVFTNLDCLPFEIQEMHLQGLFSKWNNFIKDEKILSWHSDKNIMMKTSLETCFWIMKNIIWYLFERLFFMLKVKLVLYVLEEFSENVWTVKT